MVLVQNVSKLYRLYRRPVDRFWESLSFSGRSRHQDFWALKNVSFSAGKGDVFGLVGPNGSGKSTLLQVISGILKPSAGRVSVEGRLAALLELGAGFNPEFTGRENYYLNSEIMGLSRLESDRAFASVREFAGIGDFMDRPVKEYSSGMYVRLAFSTAIHVSPDILVIDEALAVGDAMFANRCLRKLEEIREQGVTILFVSHDLGLVKRLCNRAALMLNGEIVSEGEPAEVVNRYIALVHDQTFDASSHQDRGVRHGDGGSTIERLRLLNDAGDDSASFRPGETITLHAEVRFHRACENPMVGVLIRSRLNIDVFGTNTRIEGLELGSFDAGDLAELRFRIPCWLTRQEYTVTVAIQNEDGTSQDWRDDILSFQVIDSEDRAGLMQMPVKVEVDVHKKSRILA